MGGGHSVHELDIDFGVFSAFAGIRLGANAIHRYCERTLRLRTQGAERHGLGGEPPHDRLDGFDFFERDGAADPESQQVADGERLAPVHFPGKVVIGVAVVVFRGSLQVADYLRAVGVALEALAKPIEAGKLDFVRRVPEGAAVAVENVATEVHPFPPAHQRARIREAAAHDFVAEPDDFEKFSAQVTGQGRDPHLRHDLLQA